MTHVYAINNEVTDNPAELELPNSMEQSTKGSLKLRQILYKHRGVLCMLLAAFVFSLENVLFRFIENDIHNTEVVFSTSLLKVCFLLPVITYNGYSLKAPSKVTYSLLIGRGILGMISLNAFFYSLRYLKVGDATAILLSSPVFVGVFARIFLKEAFGIIHALLTLVVVVGVFLISKPSFIFGGSEKEATSNFIGASIAGFSCITYALANIMNRQLGLFHVNSLVNVLYFVSIGSVGTGALTSIVGGWSMPPCGYARITVVTMGILGCSGQWLITYAFSAEKSVLLAIVQTNEIIFAYLLEFLLFNVTPDLIALLGVCLVVSASLVSSVKKRKENTLELSNKETGTS